MTPEQFAYNSGMTVETMLQLMQQQFQGLVTRLDQRHADLVLRLDERDISRQRAVEVALVVQKEAVDEVKKKTEDAIQHNSDQIDGILTALAEGSGRNAGITTAKGQIYAAIGIISAIAGAAAAFLRPG